MLNKISEFWCKKMHAGAMWPIHGKYICRKCLRTYPVAWEGVAKPQEYADSSLQRSEVRINSTVSLLQ